MLAESKSQTPNRSKKQVREKRGDKGNDSVCQVMEVLVINSDQARLLLPLGKQPRQIRLSPFRITMSQDLPYALSCPGQASPGILCLACLSEARETGKPHKAKNGQLGPMTPFRCIQPRSQPQGFPSKPSSET